CCPHVSPDGEWVAYLSLPLGGEKYEAEKSTGPLHLVRTDGIGDRVVAETARTYFENRAVVWRSPTELIFIDGEGRTRHLDLGSGESRNLTDKVLPTFGWLIDSTMNWATTGRPSFSPYESGRRAIVERGERGGCQPYFSADGRWGYWVAGAGGPINRLDLTTGEVSTILRKSDDRLPGDFGYLYFPMFSTDGSLFAFAASPDEHDHLEGNYEVFAAESDPRTLEISGPIVRITEQPGADRFPDIFARPLPLGRQSGEAPLAVELRPPGEAGEWTWSFGDGDVVRAEIGRHTYRDAGAYSVEASRAGERLTGLVRVHPAAAPRVVRVEVTDNGFLVRVFFDEPIVGDGAEVVFDSGREILEREIGRDGETLEIRLAEPLTRLDRLRLAGIGDRASRPNTIGSIALEVEPPLWPGRTEGLVFLWKTGDAPNLVFDPRVGASRASLLTASGRARFDRFFRMKLRGGLFAASPEESNALRWALQATNELTLEASVTTAGKTPIEAFLVDFGERGRGSNFGLIQRGGNLFFTVRTSPRQPTNQEVLLTAVERHRTRHLVLSYSPGILTLDVDGKRTLETDVIQGDFFHWRTWRLAFGDQWGGGGDWGGELEGLAIYDRVLGVEEVRENFLRYRRELGRRPLLEGLVVEARLKKTSPVPSLDEIRPYREALIVEEYTIERILKGELPETSSDSLVVASWGILDGRRVSSGATPNEVAVLNLEPFDAQTQLESVYSANGLGRSPEYFRLLD
ncbi:MAG: PKD domain-containing protein, partial [Acidobacteriota bacterium]|nr:PKD domain-containing protein [Acidobacteriota bacterium]